MFPPLVFYFPPSNSTVRRLEKIKHRPLHPLKCEIIFLVLLAPLISIYDFNENINTN